MRILLSVPHMGGSEKRYVQEAFDSNWLSTVGPNIAAFERAFSERIGLPAVALGSGTAALHLALRLAGVGPGDWVFCPTLTFVATANPVRYLGADPVLLDSERATWNLDPNVLEEALRDRSARNRLPRAVIVVDLFGQCADMDPILDLCDRYQVPVVEDAAEALGATYHGRAAGTFGHVSVFSFNGNKIITTTGGGMLVSPNADWVEKARFWSTQARDPGLAYEHSEIGYNYRMSNVLAGIGRGQLEVLDLRVRQRRAINAAYRAAFADVPGLEPMPEAGQTAAGGCSTGILPVGRPPGRRCYAADRQDAGATAGSGPDSPLAVRPALQPESLHTHWLSCFLIDERLAGCSRDRLIGLLNEQDIESRPVWKPMHLQPLYARAARYGGHVAEDLFDRGICLPSSSSLSAEDQLRVIRAVRAACGAPALSVAAEAGGKV